MLKFGRERNFEGESERDESDGINCREGENEVDNGKTLPQLESCSLVWPEGGGGGCGVGSMA